MKMKVIPDPPIAPLFSKVADLKNAFMLERKF